MILLDYEGNYEYHFGPYIEIMGCYLLVLIAHDAAFRRYQTLYLLDWVQGRIVCVSNLQHLFHQNGSLFNEFCYLSSSAGAWQRTLFFQS
jgi:hypothetical protein